MSGRRMNVRKCKDGSYRARFYHLHEEQIETIELALKSARLEGESDFDSVALDRICMNYLACNSTGRPKKVTVVNTADPQLSPAASVQN